MIKIETDRESGAEVYQLTDGEQGYDNIGNEQPCADATSTRIAVRCGVGGIGEDTPSVSVVAADLETGKLHPLWEAASIYPTTPCWGEYLYCMRVIRGRRMICRTHYQSFEEEKLYAFPEGYRLCSLLSVDPEGRFCATTASRGEWAGDLLLMDLQEQTMRILYSDDERHLSLAQFSCDGNHLISFVATPANFRRHGARIGVLSAHQEASPRWLPFGPPHTHRCTGHNVWIPNKDKIVASCRYAEDIGGSLFAARAGDARPRIVGRSHTFFAHVGISRCARFWVADGYAEGTTPIYIGTLKGGNYRRIVHSQTTFRGPQESHTHPYLTADNRWLIFTSARSGRAQVYAARVPEGFLNGLLAEARTESRRADTAAG